MAVAVWPWGFWKSLKMSHEMRWRRIAAYLVMLVGPLYLLVGVGHGMAARAQWVEIYGDGPTSMPSPFKAVIQSALLPYSDTSPGSVSIPAGMFGAGPTITPFPPPSQQVRIDWGDLFGNPVLPMLLGMVVLCPAGFLALPVSRRRAKVRYAHIHRVTLYSITFMVLPIGGLLAGPVFEEVAWNSLIAQLLWVAAVGAVILLPVPLVIWWSCATGRYLKIRHAWGVGLAVVVMASLVTLLATILLYLLVS
jgi:hypothetical protein